MHWQVDLAGNMAYGQATSVVTERFGAFHGIPKFPQSQVQQVLNPRRDVGISAEVSANGCHLATNNFFRLP